MINIGEQLKYIRETYDLTQTDIASLFNISKSSISHYEKNDWIIPMKHLITLADYLNISIDYILGLTKKKNYNNYFKGINLTNMSKNINIIYKENKFTNVSLANILNTSESTLRNYRNGKYLILTNFAIQISLKFNYSIDYIIGKTNTNNLKRN